MRTVPRRLVLLTPALALLAACGADDASSGGGSPDGASGNGAELDAQAFSERVGEPGTVVVDVRTPGEFAAGHLADAVNLDLQSADFASRLSELDPDARYALYCQSGNRSGQAMATMLDEGFSDVAHLGGGIGAWQTAGLPVVTG
ncbi:rhodanese-like domain-containing protein [Ornithinimicrobium sp. LYQ121]|uniref:rhodanese-like domain-containing protein n=1 Tax=Ornithinimicrobium sp. LYQ121 TaxID=3378801 RepID=UPI0038551CBB